MEWAIGDPVWYWGQSFGKPKRKIVGVILSTAPESTSVIVRADYGILTRDTPIELRRLNRC